MFCRTVGVPCHPAPRRIGDLFDGAFIEDAFLTRELSFDASRLASRLHAELAAAGIELRLRTEARILAEAPGGVDVAVNDAVCRASYVFNCTYADIEFAGVTLRAGIKRELAEMVLIAPPPELRNLGVTVMDGPFFSTMPFPAAGLHSLSHVRYTPHESSASATEGTLMPRKSNSTAILHGIHLRRESDAGPQRGRRWPPDPDRAMCRVAAGSLGAGGQDRQHL
jgi:hypothetical protein